MREILRSEDMWADLQKSIFLLLHLATLPSKWLVTLAEKNKKLPDHIACFVALEHPRFINSPVRDFAQASFAK